MKLWFQGYTAPETDPAWRDYLQCLDKHLHKVARPDTEIDLHSTKVFSPGIVSHQYHAYLQTSQMIEAAIQAEREGYDAFVQTGALDLGFFEIREVVDIPVIFSVETALHVGTLLAPKVAFLVMNQIFLSRLNEKAKLYGFQERLTPGGWINLAPRDLQLAFKNPRPTVELLVEEAKRIGEQGANILICAGNPITMLLVDQGVTEIDGVRILDSLGVLVKVAEMMVDLHKMGITRSKMGLYSPLPKEEVESVRKLYGAE